MFDRKKKVRQPDSHSWSNSEHLLQLKSSVGRTQKQPLTGYESYREHQKQVKESLRFENSYGTVAFGGDKRRGLTILISEKRRHNSPGITAKEKKLQESRQVKDRAGRGNTAANPGGRTEGAFAFTFQADVSRVEMMARMRRHLTEHEQVTVRRMLPFLTPKGMRQGQPDRTGQGDRERGQSERRRQVCQQQEQDFGRKLTLAIKDVRKEPEAGKKRQILRRPLVSLLSDTLNQQEKPQDKRQDESSAQAARTGEDTATGPDAKKDAGK